MAIVTLGDGYHNYHHEFQHDYRNGVKPWQIDPTKWLIWTLSKLGFARKLRRVPMEVDAARNSLAHRPPTNLPRCFSAPYAAKFLRSQKKDAKVRLDLPSGIPVGV
jgi:cytochrome b involved in lipid metabolism